MRSQKTSLMATFALSLAFSATVFAQSQQYQRPKAATPVPTEAGKKAAPGKGDAKATTAPAAEDKSDKVDISELEEKYWAPKDVDFSVVQNRTYTKAARYSFSSMTGILINDPYNDGTNFSAKANYYFDERQGVELSYTTTDAKNSSATRKFRGLSGGGVLPDFNRDKELISLGYNFVPFYAKMSFMGKKILYFDMQVTPWIGQAKYTQVHEGAFNDNEESSFAYGLDITQYYFVHKNFAVRFDYHNRWYKQDVLAYSDNNGAVARSGENAYTTMILLGFTYFMGNK